MRTRFLIAVFSLVPALAWAARPFVTDDARLTSEGSCQLESWGRLYRDSQEFWALPACNPGGNFEVTLGGGQARNTGMAPTEDYVIQAKTLFRPLKTDDWGWGLAVGNIRHPEVNPGPNLLGNSYLYLPFSRSLNGDQTVVHANVGRLKDRASGAQHTTWGLGGEFRLNTRWQAIAEVFGDDQVRPYWQVGARYAVVPDKVQIDATVGQQMEGPLSGRWFSLGLRLTPEHFLAW